MAFAPDAEPSLLAHGGMLLLDQAALDAVLQWVFEPTVVDGVATPVLMNVTVQFTGE